MFPKTGNSFPMRARGGGAQTDYAARIAAVLRSEVGDTHQATKTLMRWTGANERTVKNWLCGINGPSGVHLIALARHSDSVLEVFLRMAGREGAVAVQRLLDLRSRLHDFVALLDLLNRDHVGAEETSKGDSIPNAI